ncbi:hypothetical protein [Candidatus Enterococcus clewellii]|uniref:DUF5673 domain-containing protein n=1 Tax=Candidatus Enterococcus clewellii TaxID=1834193 RepID=A0A242KC64_9ENTE|nr:hypothetical protein [Enterococcus sp. 9E7_DIV0242]OTP18556.1 hypothetical protein A5888_000370 [Enterococcus sp. 9E7_DIV0242]
MEFFTIILLLFVIILYAYLILVRKSIQVFAKRSPAPAIIGAGLGFVFLLFGLFTPQTLNDKMQDVLTACLLFSFLLDCKGLADTRIITNSFDNRGISYSELEKIVLQVKDQDVHMNYFRKGRRGPIMHFKMPIEQLLSFLSDKVANDLQIDIVIEE